jgi:hypothetical protein
MKEYLGLVISNIGVFLLAIGIFNVAVIYGFIAGIFFLSGTIIWFKYCWKEYESQNR